MSRCSRRQVIRCSENQPTARTRNPTVVFVWWSGSASESARHVASSIATYTFSVAGALGTALTPLTGDLMADPVDPGLLLGVGAYQNSRLAH